MSELPPTSLALPEATRIELVCIIIKNTVHYAQIEPSPKKIPILFSWGSGLSIVALAIACAYANECGRSAPTRLESQEVNIEAWGCIRAYMALTITLTIYWQQQQEK